jgi:hypothetical protein
MDLVVLSSSEADAVQCGVPREDFASACLPTVPSVISRVTSQPYARRGGGQGFERLISAFGGPRLRLAEVRCAEHAIVSLDRDKHEAHEESSSHSGSRILTTSTEPEERALWNILPPQTRRGS